MERAGFGGRWPQIELELVVQYPDLFTVCFTLSYTREVNLQTARFGGTTFAESYE